MTKKLSTKAGQSPRKQDEALLCEIRLLIEQTRSHVAQTVNSALVVMNWHIGRRINNEILQNKRAEYGAEILPTLSAKLVTEYGNSFTRANLFRMIQFAEVFPVEEIVVTLSRQLSWSHFLTIIPLKDQLKRDFYAEMCRIERWSVRTLREKIQGMLFERTAISKKPEKLIKTEIESLRAADKLTPDLVFRDTYFLDFLAGEPSITVGLLPRCRLSAQSRVSQLHHRLGPGMS